MTIGLNTFKRYATSNISSMKILAIKSYILRGKIFSTKFIEPQIDFGHYKGFQTTKKELKLCFKYNRQILIKEQISNLKNNKLNFIFKKFEYDGNPSLINSSLKKPLQEYSNLFESRKGLKRIKMFKKLINGRILRRTKRGLVISILGLQIFLPKKLVETIEQKVKRKQLRKRKPIKNINRGLEKEFLNKRDSLFSTIPLRLVQKKRLKKKRKKRRSKNKFLHKHKIRVLKNRYIRIPKRTVASIQHAHTIVKKYLKKLITQKKNCIKSLASL